MALPLVLAAWLVAGCAADVTYRMVRPQVSGHNHYVGPDLEVTFRFHRDYLTLILRNSGDTDISVDWSQASFVGADGRAVPLVSTGKPLIGTVPLGSVTQVDLAPSELATPRGGLWQRRAFMEKRLVHPILLERCSPMVRILLPVMRYSSNRAEFEMNEFIFQVLPEEAAAADDGGNDDDSPY